MQRRAAGLALAVALLLGGCTASTPSGQGAASGSASPTPTAPVSLLSVGDCTADVDLTGASIANVPAVPCTQTHNWEVHTIVPVSGDSYPGATVLAQQATQVCAAGFLDYVGVEAAYSRYTSAYLTADEGAWATPANRMITCLAGSPDGGLVGSVKGDTLIFPAKGECTGPQDVAAQAVQVIDCAKKHYYEVFASKDLTGSTAPTAAEEKKLFASVCQAGFKDFVGIEPGRSVYEVAYFIPGEDIWDKVKDHRFVCSAGSPKGGITGSLKSLKK
jgi:hypothetical protein